MTDFSAPGILLFIVSTIVMGIITNLLTAKITDYRAKHVASLKQKKDKEIELENIKIERIAKNELEMSLQSTEVLYLNSKFAEYLLLSIAQILIGFFLRSFPNEDQSISELIFSSISLLMFMMAVLSAGFSYRFMESSRKERKIYLAARIYKLELEMEKKIS